MSDNPGIDHSEEPTKTRQSIQPGDSSPSRQSADNLINAVCSDIDFAVRIDQPHSQIAIAELRKSLQSHLERYILKFLLSVEPLDTRNLRSTELAIPVVDHDALFIRCCHRFTRPVRQVQARGHSLHALAIGGTNPWRRWPNPETRTRTHQPATSQAQRAGSSESVLSPSEGTPRPSPASIQWRAIRRVHPKPSEAPA